MTQTEKTFVFLIFVVEIWWAMLVHLFPEHIGKMQWSICLSIIPNMEYCIVTDDVESANRMLPDIPAYHVDVAWDYVAVKNARNVICTTSTFSCFPLWTSKNLEMCIAPKYCSTIIFLKGGGVLDAVSIVIQHIIWIGMVNSLHQTNVE